MERGVSSPEDGESFHQLGQLLKVLVERAVEFGAARQRHHLARFARMKIAQVVQLANVVVALAVDGGLRRWPAACWWSCPSPKPRRSGCRSTRAFTMPATRSMAAADSTDVPPNFITIMSVQQSFRMHQFRVEHGGAGRAANRVVAERDELPVEAPGMGAAGRRTPPCRARARRLCAAADGRLPACSARDASARSADSRSCGRPRKSRRRCADRLPMGLRRKLHRDRHGVAIDHRHAIAVRAHLGGQRLDVIAARSRPGSSASPAASSLLRCR